MDDQWIEGCVGNNNGGGVGGGSMSGDPVAIGD